jgi:hypothetical protein
MGAYPNPMSDMRSGYYGAPDSGGGAGGSGYAPPPMFGGGSSNQWYGQLPMFSNPGQASSPTSGPGGGGAPAPNPSASPAGDPYQVPTQGSSGLQIQNPAAKDSSKNIGSGIVATGLQYPGLSQNLAYWLNSQIGQGMSPFNLSTPLPTGGMTQPGQLTAGLNPLLQQLMQFFQTGQGGNMPGLSNLSNIANNGVSALPEWQSMIAAQQQNIGQNQAQLKEQFAGMGDLAGSPFGNAESNFMQQTTLDQNALLGQLQQSNIQNIQMPAIQSLFQGSQGMASGLQNLDQQAIQNMYQEFQRIAPQNNPALQMEGAFGSLYPPTTKTPTSWDMINQTIGALSGSGFSSGGSSGSGGSGGYSIQF